MAKKRNRRMAATAATRDKLSGRRRSRLPIIILGVVTAIASLALVVASFLNFGSQPH